MFLRSLIWIYYFAIVVDVDVDVDVDVVVFVVVVGSLPEWTRSFGVESGHRGARGHLKCPNLVKIELLFKP